MGVDLIGVDLVGVDFMGVDLVGMNPSLRRESTNPLIKHPCTLQLTLPP